MGKKKERIITDQAVTPLGTNPFTGLDPAGLPVEPQPPPDLENEGEAKATGGARVEIRREKSGRGGKTVTTLRGFGDASKDDLETLLRDLKKQTGCGGSLLPDGLLLQGDCRDQIEGILRSAGYQAVRAGG